MPASERKKTNCPAVTMLLRAEQPISLVSCVTLLTAVSTAKPVPSVLANWLSVASQIDLRQKIST